MAGAFGVVSDGEDDYEDCDCSEPDCDCDEEDKDYDDYEDFEDYDDEDEIAPGGKALCTECLCKGMYA